MITSAAVAATAALLFGGAAAAQIQGLCNTGETVKNVDGCSSHLVAPNPAGGGPNQDGNWSVTYSSSATPIIPCELTGYALAYVDTPPSGWVGPNTSSEWIMPYDGEDNHLAGWYVYSTVFAVPAVLPDGSTPKGVTVNGQVSSDNTTYSIYLYSPANAAHPANCSTVSGQTFPVNPKETSGEADQQQWWPFHFTNRDELSPGGYAIVYFVVLNAYFPSVAGGESPTAFRAEFSSNSAFH